MNGRMIVMPSRTEILCRSITYGAGCGAAVGALVAAVPAAVFVPISLVVVPEFGAVVGAMAGVACGFCGGLGLVIFRRQVSVSRAGVRAVAGAGAGLLPAAWLVAGVIDSGRFWSPVLALLTAVVVLLAGALGPFAFYGRPRRRSRSRRRPSQVQRES